MTEEIWKPINGYEGYYVISSEGRIKSLHRNMIMKPFYYKKWDYWRIELRRDGARKLFKMEYILHDHFPEIFDLQKVKDLEGEQWRPVTEYVGNYYVSNFGRIKSSNEKRRGENLLTCTTNPYGYFTVVLYKDDGKRHTCFLHRLIAKAFIEKIEGKDVVNHKRGVKKENYVENLEWCTYKENSDHAWANGLINNRGENNGRAKLTDYEAFVIKYQLKDVPPQRIATMFNIGKESVIAIWQNKRWAHI